MMAFLLSFIILSVIMVGRYFLMAGVFAHLWPMKERNRSQVRRDIKWSLMSSSIFAFFGALVIFSWEKGWTKIYLDIGAFPFWYIPLSLVLYLFVHDTYFYWTHRWMHQHYFRQIHFAHHESRDPTAWTSFAFHPYEAVIQAILLPVLILMVPIHLSILGVFLVLMSLFGVTNHLGHEIYSENLSKKYSLITATHHDLHHKKMTYNFGLYFSFWDKWMRTEHP